MDTLARRRTGLALSNTLHSIGEEEGKPVAAIVVSNDDGTTGARVRITRESTGEDAEQGDIFIAANSTRTFYVTRKQRDAQKTTDRLYLKAVADT